MNRVLITGGGGFIGSHLGRAYVRQGSDVTIVARPGSALHRLADLDEHLRVVRVDLTDTQAVAQMFDDIRPNVVFHLANTTRITPRKDLGDVALTVSENLGPLLTVLSGALNCAHPPEVFVRTGSIAEYGTIPPPFGEASREVPADPYGVSLLAGTHYLRVMQPKLPFPAITARLALTYGPDQSGDFLVPSMIEALVSGLPIDLRRPDDLRDLIHVEDAVDGLMTLAAHASVAPPLANVSTGISTSTADVARMIAVYSGADPALITFGTPVGPPVMLCSDPALLRTSLGWQPRVAIADGLQRTVAWRQQKNGGQR
ncbi:NAD-dependent epimerase/dehydratase family protein [Aliiruegeria lutimaris]|uniref:UDP-glucose 4-epimerase n=1 Tax=Aliiruegeria lutimaris TaxID=571298 RepID=A0A1G9FRG2_9RHOB|nr:NAD(P)-dependent oxidoreductase [Aliiruegeria lutimaris]SDK90994.1 UDP-glucose 4-epimerase [Aliiruegeria lutimaris]